MDLGTKIKILRTEKGLSYDKLALMSKTSKSQLWAIEKNRTKPSAEKLNNIAISLDTTVDFLLSDEEKDKSNVVGKEVLYRNFKKLSKKNQKIIFKTIKDWSAGN